MTFIGLSLRAIKSNGFFAKWRTGAIRLFDKRPPQIMEGVCVLSLWADMQVCPLPDQGLRRVDDF